MELQEIKQVTIFKAKNCKFIRALAYPYMNYKRKSGKKEYALTKDAKYIQSLSSSKKGKRCFILGNGPSLTPNDLDKLKEEDTFAFNRIFYMFDRTDWRPTYYMCVDPGVLGLNKSAIKKLTLPNMILSSVAKPYIKDKIDNIHYLYDYSRFKLNRWDYDPPYISEDVSDHFCFCYTVTFDAIQLAIYMGYKEIYLLGVDHNYSVKVDTNGHVQRDESVKDYFDGLEKTSLTAMNYEATTAAFEEAHRYCDSHGIIMKNATRGGKLEVFERIDFDELMRGDV